MGLAEEKPDAFLVPKFHLGTPPVPRKISFRAHIPSTIMGSAMKLPPQARSQAPAEGSKLGNEDKFSLHVIHVSHV
jgi:hypothetical protein